MAAYVIGELLELTDPAGFREYRRRVPDTIARYGGRFIARQGAIERLDGPWQPAGLTIIEFPSFEQAKRWYDSDEYRELKALRLRAARTTLVLTDGL
jgi:uncharacterized protein (DUF1330 family)